MGHSRIPYLGRCTDETDERELVMKLFQSEMIQIVGMRFPFVLFHTPIQCFVSGRSVALWERSVVNGQIRRVPYHTKVMPHHIKMTS